jgi:DNA-binding HxlR family transcriptional regulator
MKNKNEIAFCAVDYAFKRVGGKYKGRIIWVLREDVLRYGELKRAIVGITPKMLTQTLKELESDQLVFRKVYLQVPPKVEYSLTTSGKELVPFIKQLRTWAVDQMDKKNIKLNIK